MRFNGYVFGAPGRTLLTMVSTAQAAGIGGKVTVEA